MAQVSAACRICRTSPPSESVVEHAQAHRGRVTITIAGQAKKSRRPRSRGRRSPWRTFLPFAGGGVGGIAGVIVFGSLLIALLCGVLAFAGIRRLIR
ncbi:MAG: hypothetical protein JWO67_2687 [Streptosporangiaceae bacterium]|nr:hypothetical protein [Streptosporangiaceae bacterium]